MGKVATEATLVGISDTVNGVNQDITQQKIVDALVDLKKSIGASTKLILTARATDDSEIPDQTVRIYNATTGDLFATTVVNSSASTTVEVLSDNSYKIVPENTVAGYYTPRKPTVYVLQSVSVELVWKALGEVDDIADLKYLIDEGKGGDITLGITAVKIPHKTLGDIYFECVDWDSDTNTMTLLCGAGTKTVTTDNDTLKDQLQFDAPEAFAYAESAMPAGAYTFKIGSTSYYFTLTKSLPAGGQICFDSNVANFTAYASATSTDAYDSGSISTTAISGATDLGTCGSGSLNHADRVKYGSNDYGESNICQWLSASADAGKWWEAKTHFDRPSAYSMGSGAIAGFLAGIESDYLECIDDTDVKCVAQTTYCAPDSEHTKGAKYTVNSKFFLASQKEIFGTADFDDGSTLYDLYDGASDTDRIKRYGGSARHWWLRSPYPSAYSERLVNTSGAVSYGGACLTYGVVPACKISKSS